MSTSKIIIVVTLALAVAGYFLLEPAPTDTEAPSNLPWQIELDSEGRSRVFGITLESTTVAQMIERLGQDHELAIISDNNDQSGLEVYFSHFAAGPIKGKLIARIQADSQTLNTMQASASRKSYTSSGSRKFMLNEQDLERIRQWPVDSLSFIPSANLDEAIILSRFGEPDQRIHTEAGIQHFLYTNKGLDIALSEDTKELLQYVAPRNFNQLLAPLQNIEPPTIDLDQ